MAVFTSGPLRLTVIFDPRDYQEVLDVKLDAGLNTSELSDPVFLISIYLQETMAVWAPGGGYPTHEVRVRPYPTSYPPSQ